VEDTGPGISDDARPHLFTPFFTTKQNGQGIGLTMVQEILRRTASATPSTARPAAHAVPHPVGSGLAFRSQLQVLEVEAEVGGG